MVPFVMFGVLAVLGFLCLFAGVKSGLRRR